MTIGLNDYEFQLGATGVRLNSDSSGIPFVDITSVQGLDNAPFRETFRDHEGVDGGFLDAEFETGRDIVLEGTVYCSTSSVEPFLDSLKSNFAPVRDPIPFYFKSTGVTERLINVKPRGCSFDWRTAKNLGITPIQFKMYAEDPRIYDSDSSSVSVPFGGPATTGFGFNFGFNLSFGATVPVTGATVVVNGNRPTPAVMTIVGPTVNPRIINVTDSLSLDFIITLGGTDTLAVDLANRTVTLNGLTNARNTLQRPDWWLFDPGNTFVVFGGGSGVGSSVSIVYRNAWR